MTSRRSRPRRRGRVAPRRRAAAVLLCVLTGAAPGLAWAAPASAHAHLVRAVPGDGATVTSAPAQVQLVFDENVRNPATIVVTNPDGDRVERGTTQAVDNTVTIRVAAGAGGRYRIAFRVVSADGHPVAGTTSFRLEPSGTARPGGAGHAGSGDAAASGSGFSRGRIIGIVAVSALLLGLALLTVRRLPGGLVNPGGRHRP